MRVDAEIERRGRWWHYVTLHEHHDAGELSDWPVPRLPMSFEVGYAFVFGEKRARAKAQRMIRKRERKIEYQQRAITVGNTGHVVIHEPRGLSERLVFPWG